MITSYFKRSIIISLLGHITIFSIFNFSFGNKIPRADSTPIAFWGAILRDSDLIVNRSFSSQNFKETFIRKPNMTVLDRTNREYLLISNYYLKPTATLGFNKDKIVFIPKTHPILFTQSKKSTAIMFYPHLPHHFLLYFKDRQAVHIELMFNIISNRQTNSIAIKRKISSGNLEADLFVMRYISHYLFIQQTNFSQNNWQTVKIDLSAKND